MKIFVERTNKSIDLDFEGPAEELLKKIGINKEAVLVSRNGKLIAENENLQNNDSVKILSVISGG